MIDAMSTSTSQPMNEYSSGPAKGLQPAMGSNAQGRRVLGEVSPNVKAMQSSNRPALGSPLKRSFTAMVEQGSGFQYLKRRRSSGENGLESSEISQHIQGPPRRVFRDSVVEQLPTTELIPQDESPLPELPDLNIPQIQEPSPTEPNTPSSLDEERDETQSSSLDRKSFSSLINYEPSSQTSQFRTSSTLFPPTSHAEMLRLRLRVAMYKVRTNQIDVPFDQLDHATQQQQQQSATSRAVEEAVAQLRREAQLDLARQQQQAASKDSAGTSQLAPRLKLRPAPVLLPTAYSSRMIYEPTNLPSSPPVVASPVRKADGTPQPRRTADQDLTSSVVKGRVAEGLLGLRNAA